MKLPSAQLALLCLLVYFTVSVRSCMTVSGNRITSYNYGYQYCDKTITSPANTRVQLTFQSFALMTGWRQYLNLLGGSTSPTYRGQNRPPVYTSRNNRVRLRYYRYYGSNYGGFTITWSYLDGCNPSPCSTLGGTCSRTSSSPYYRCTCRGGYSGSTCSTHVCSRNYCLNGASCTKSTRSPYYRCTCLGGFSGSTCNTHVCSRNYCLNGATCTRNTTTPYYRCTCLGGYSGRTCNTHVCSSNVCLNRATCARSTRSPYYRCTCRGGYSGYTCNTHVCRSQYCRNNATCSTNTTSPYYECSCAQGYVGFNCTTDLCQPSPCMNSGNCLRANSSFQCACASGYSGRTCSYVELDVVAAVAGLSSCLILAIIVLIILYRLKTKKQIFPNSNVIWNAFGAKESKAKDDEDTSKATIESSSQDGGVVKENLADGDDDVNTSAPGKYPETDNEKNTFENPGFVAEGEEKVSGDQNPESEVKTKELTTAPPRGDSQTINTSITVSISK